MRTMQKSTPRSSHLLRGLLDSLFAGIFTLEGFENSGFDPRRTCRVRRGVARLSRNVRQPDHVLANSFAGHKAQPWPGAGEEWLSRPEYDGMDVESILINQIKAGQAP